jgi:uncharacterized protein
MNLKKTPQVDFCGDRRGKDRARAICARTRLFRLIIIRLMGSADVLLLPNLSESLAGRMEVLTLWPFSQGEMRGVRGGFLDALFSKQTVWRVGTSGTLRRAELFERILAGGYPPVATRRQVARRRAWFQSYLMTILQRDIRDLANIIGHHRRASTAVRGGRPREWTIELRGFVEKPLPSTNDLETIFCLAGTTFLVQLLRPWSVNTGQRAILTSKVYLNDTGLLPPLVGLTLERLELNPGMAGSVLENFVLMELRKQSVWSETQPQLSYWRTASGQEVDMVLEDSSGHLVGVDVKASATLRGGDIARLQYLAKASGKRWIRGVVLYTGTEVIPFANNLHTCMVYQYLCSGQHPGDSRC